ncbi:MAG TPA: hypothetical protein VG498_16395 [Terriglobales bacterium]|nr:hypothetical protein [Terriglobales bacterium]
MEQEKKPSQFESERIDREGDQDRKQQEKKFPGQSQQGQRSPGQPGQQEPWKQPGQTGEEKEREDVA